MNAADVMATNVITVRSNTSVEEIAEILLANRISAVPVVNEAGALVGIVSEGDLIHRVEAGTERHRSWWLELLTLRETLAHEFVKSHARKAADLMSHPVVTVGPDMPLGDIASVLEKYRIKRVPVVKDGKIVGIVSRANLIQALVRRGRETPSEKTKEDTALHADIEKELRSHPWGYSDIHVVVQNGSVELWGLVDSEAEKDAIRIAVEVMPGVRSIANHLSVHSRVTRGV